MTLEECRAHTPTVDVLLNRVLVRGVASVSMGAFKNPEDFEMLWRKEVASIQSYQFYGFRLITELKTKKDYRPTTSLLVLITTSFGADLPKPVSPNQTIEH